MQRGTPPLQRLFVLDWTQGYLPTLLYTAAAYATGGADALVVDPVKNAGVIRAAIDRFTPAEVWTTAPLPEGALPRGYGPRVRHLPASLPQVLAFLVDEVLPQARGAVLFPAHSASWAVRAAALAVRLGWVAWPVEEALGLALAGPPRMELAVVGEAPDSLTHALQGRTWIHLSGDGAIAAFLRNRQLPVDYLVVVNTADLTPPQYHEEGLAGYWTPALSLLAPVLASYRPALVWDARTPRPDGRAIEAAVNAQVEAMGIQPRYLAVLASPGAVPFVTEPQVEFRELAEEPVRDIHLRLNGDLFFDCAEGRIFALTPGRAGLQILTTKHYHRLDGDWRRRAVVAFRPHFAGNVIYAVDEAVARTQLVPAFRCAGLEVTELYGTGCTPDRLAPALAQAGLFFYGGWGTPFGLETHGGTFAASDLPDLPPCVAYACAGSTVRPKPLHVSADGGHSYQDHSLPEGEVIGPAFIERGAVAFVGGLTAEDVLFNTAMYNAFFHALVLQGQSVGEAVRAARNYALLFGQVLSQQDPVAFRRARPALGETVGQQLLLGDPAFAPFSGVAHPAVRQEAADEGDAALAVRVEVNPGDWHRVAVPVDPLPQTLAYHRCRTLELWAPFAAGALVHADPYPVRLPGAEVAARGLCGALLHLQVPLPPGRVVDRMELVGAALDDAGCLCCGAGGPVPEGRAALQRFVLPFGPETLTYDMSRGWSFALEERPGGLTAHWLVPAVVIDPATGRAYRLRRAEFRLHLVPAVRVEGRLELPGTGRLPEHVLLTFGRPLPETVPVAVAHGGAGPAAEPRVLPVCQVRAGADGTFAAWLPAEGELGVRVSRPFPTYDFCYQAPASYKPWTYVGIQAGPGPLAIRLAPTETGVIVGTVVDLQTGRPLERATVRVFTGGVGADGRPFATGYVAQLQTDPIGRFRIEVPYGQYVVAAQTRGDYKYFPARAAVTVHVGQVAPVLLGLAPGATVRGRVRYQGGRPPRAATLRVVPAGGGWEPYASAFIYRDGEYEALAPAGTPFAVSLQVEGYRPVLDAGDGGGYVLAPGEELVRDYTLVPDPEA